MEHEKDRRQPEALANFAATARSRDKVSPTGGREVTAETRDGGQTRTSRRKRRPRSCAKGR